jgi:hypothetical protein
MVGNGELRPGVTARCELNALYSAHKWQKAGTNLHLDRGPALVAVAASRAGPSAPKAPATCKEVLMRSLVFDEASSRMFRLRQ